VEAFSIGNKAWKREGKCPLVIDLFVAHFSCSYSVRHIGNMSQFDHAHSVGNLSGTIEVCPEMSN